jgi:hypothetical protein
MRTLAMLALLLVAACAAEPNLPDVSDACATTNGADACREATAALCARIVMCCAADVAMCATWAQSADECRGHLSANGLDCAASTRTSASVCSSDVRACVDAIPLVACSDLYAGTFNLPRACDPLP